MSEAHDIEPAASEERIQVPHVVQGRTVIAPQVEHRSRGLGSSVWTPKIALNELVWPRAEPVPALDTPMTEIIDFLVELGRRLALDSNPYLAEALQRMSHFNALGRRVLENCYRDLPLFFQRAGIEREIEHCIGGTDLLDGWKRYPLGSGSIRIRAFPPRMAHILAGNAPIVPPMTVIRGAITKGVHLLKLPSNDMFTATAILRTMADIDARHPVTRSFTAVYWRGGDAQTESAIFRSQYFDKLVVWGGDAAVRHALKYVGPGFEMISFDPKVSISLIGREVFAAEAALEETARNGAADAISFNQDACSASRFQFVEGSVEQVDRYCERLAAAMGEDTRYGNGVGPVPSAEVRDTLEMYRSLEPIYRVWGRFDGRGLVVRSDEPVDFHPHGKLVNVVQVDDLAHALRHVTVATQSVGIYPISRARTLRDGLASAGAQRLVPLGAVHVFEGYGGVPHDGSWPVNRFMKWVSQTDQETQ
jgi:hypothetical protein